MLTELLAKVESLVRRSKQETHGQFLRLARDLVEAEANGKGKTPDAGNVLKILADNGKTPADLEKAVTAFKARKVLAAEIALQPQLQREVADLERKLAALDARLKDFQDQTFREAVPLQEQLQALRLKIKPVDQLEGKLLETCPDEDLAAELSAVEVELSRVAAGQRNGWVSRHGVMSTVLQGQTRETAEAITDPANRARALQGVQRNEQELASMQNEHEANEQILEPLRARAAELRKKMMEV
jgi:hypothetical protein